MHPQKAAKVEPVLLTQLLQGRRNVEQQLAQEGAARAVEHLAKRREIALVVKSHASSQV